MGLKETTRAERTRDLRWRIEIEANAALRPLDEELSKGFHQSNACRPSSWSRVRRRGGSWWYGLYCVWNMTTPR
jgi:hypothetical protein